MNLELTPEQEELRATLRRFLADHAPLSYVRAQLDDQRGTTDEVWKGLAALGVTGLLVPEAHGGAGMGMVEVAIVAEELGRAVHPGPWAASAVGAASLVFAAGSAADQATWLPGIASGETVGTVALYDSADPHAREWSQPTTTALADGDGWALIGAKAHVPDAVAADVVFVTAASVDGMGVFAVEPDAPGVEIRATPTADGTRKEGTVALDGAPARPLGAGDASAAVAETRDRLGIASVVDGVGAAARVLELSVDYAKERRQFDRPVGSFQAVQRLCAEMLRAVELARAGAHYACWAADAADPIERHRAASVARAYAADELYQVGARAIQVHGGVGFTWEHDVQLFYKRLLTLQHDGGGAADHLEDLAAIVLD